MTVLGKGRYEVKPDLARVTVTVTTEGKTLESVGNPHQVRATRAFKVLQDVETLGVEVERSSFRVDERRVQRPIPQGPAQRYEAVVDGYMATTTFSLKSSTLDKLNEVVTRLADASLFQIESVRFQASQERAALNQARRAAMLDAKEQALAYAEPVDLELKEIVTVTDGDAEAPGGYADLPAKRASPAGSYTVQIVPPATLEFTASVNVTWRIAPRG
ncbi:uncharacterized protein YggE [Microvirga flocculans]|uniref:Uncharacterized protein YggE n=1 Tax=Microvirga flocculans TaxID=217168 RepID=A0A7W6N7I1_9HYPH|nr:SIMPL domain-containing protein [Microvirga flocculans]MBB4039676.1 uncharacterized protein YggE [Microvirga flocculans]